MRQGWPTYQEEYLALINFIRNRMKLNLHVLVTHHFRTLTYPQIPDQMGVGCTRNLSKGASDGTVALFVCAGVVPHSRGVVFGSDQFHP